MKFTITSIITIFTLLNSYDSFSFQSPSEKQELIVPLTNPGKTFKLNIGIIKGSINVIGYAGSSIIIEAYSADNRMKSTFQGMKKITSAPNLEITAEEKSNEVTVRTDSYKSSINLLVKVPKSHGIYKLSTINEGNLKIEGIIGDFELNNSNGSIEFNNISGDIIANTNNGKIIGSFDSVYQKTMAFSTLNGDLDISFPLSLKANVNLKSDQGELFSNFDVQVDNSILKTSKITQTGLYKLIVDNTIYGKINGGGSEILMRVLNGNIYLRKNKSYNHK